MTKQHASSIRDLFRPEAIVWREQRRPATGERSHALSLKAAFWCAVAIAISLAIGNLV